MTTRRPLPRFASADAALALLVVAIVGLMVVPLPTWLLDVLLAGNLAVSVAILLVTLYVGSALEITAFPSLLLVATLTRIALNVASTRLILLQADAGEVIRAFGDFAVRGNFVVGAVIFVILTIVQLVVVAKGSERVAEVGARFMLDALPGKQLAIDADLRAGTIDPDEARARRRALERESHFYGAMDGAMKFVRGDAVAAILIAVVNLVGGVAIGMGQRGLDASQAVRRYGLLTIGDGLVTELPALLLATAAGVLVTRVASERRETALGSELASQLLGVPRALGAAGVLVMGLALVPGLPAVPFVGIGALLLAAWRAGRPAAGSAHDDDPASDEAGASGFVPAVVPWSVAVGRQLASDLDGADGGRSELIERLRRHVFRERGVLLPAARVAVDATLPERGGALFIHELPAGNLGATDRALLGDAPTSLASFEAELGMALLRRAADFLGISETKALLDRLERRSAATVRAVVPKTIDVATLADVLRRLAEEGVSVRDLKGILEAVARAPGGERDPLALAEHVRTELRRALTHDLTQGNGHLDVVLLDSGIEEAVRSAIARTAAGSFLALAPAAARDVVAAVQRALGDAADCTDARAVVLTRPDVRRFVKKLLETDLPDVRVVSFAELLPEVALKTRGKATLTGL